MRPRARWLFPLLLAAACGGNVVVDPGGTSSGGAATTSQSSGSSSSSGTTATDALCVSACDAIASQCPSNGPDAGCGVSCAEIDPVFKAACPADYEAFLTCIAAHPGELCTSTTTDCNAEITAFAPCDMMVCAQTPSACM
jgi:hypothetical protein